MIFVLENAKDMSGCVLIRIDERVEAKWLRQDDYYKDGDGKVCVCIYVGSGG